MTCALQLRQLGPCAPRVPAGDTVPARAMCPQRRVRPDLRAKRYEPEVRAGSSPRSGAARALDAGHLSPPAARRRRCRGDRRHRAHTRSTGDLHRLRQRSCLRCRSRRGRRRTLRCAPRRATRCGASPRNTAARSASIATSTSSSSSTAAPRSRSASSFGCRDGAGDTVGACIAPSARPTTRRLSIRASQQRGLRCAGVAGVRRAVTDSPPLSESTKCR